MRHVLVLIGLLLCPVALLADELLPANRAIEEVVDHYVDAKLKQVKVNPASPADDATFLRRVTLDLAGRIPAAVEVQAFVSSTEADKKTRLVDRLLASPSHVRQEATELD